MENVSLIVFLALFEYMVFILVVGATRNKYGVVAPATTGNELWERLYRIQVNTAEQLILFIPAVYGFAYFVSDIWAARIGVIFLIGRMVYFIGYRKSGDKRILGAVLSAWPSYIMVFGVLYQLVKTWY